MYVRVTTKRPKMLLQILAGVLCLCSVYTVRAPLISAHLVAPNQQTSADAHQLLETSKDQNRTDHPLALQTAQQALEIFETLNDQEGTAQAQSCLAEYYVAMGDLAEAEPLYQTALAYWRQQNNSHEQAVTLLDLSLIEQRRGGWSKALAYLTEAQSLINEQTDPDQMGRVANSFGAIYIDSGEYNLGLSEYQRAREYFRQAAYPRAVNRMTMLMGNSHLLLKQYDAAATYLNEALASFTDNLDKAQCHEFLGSLHIELHEYPLALTHLQTALTIYQAAHNPVEAARVSALIAQIEEQQGILGLARGRYLSALQTFQKVQDRINEAAVNFSLGKLEMKARDYDRAETYLKRSIETTEDLRHASIGRDLTTSYSATVYDRYQAYIECLISKDKSHAASGLAIQALQTSELSRAHSLAALLRDTQGSFVNAANPSLAKRERALREAISEKMNLRTELLAQSLKEKNDKTKDPTQLKHELDQLESGLSQVQREHAQVVEEVRKLDPLFDQITQPTAYTAEQIRREVIDDDQTVLLEYMLGERASYAWAVGKNQIKFYELPRAAEINETAQQVYKLISDAPQNDADDERLAQATEALAKMVLNPLREQLNAKRLIIVADGMLNYVPFQLLPSPSDKHEPLVANYEIVNAPSATILDRLRKEKRQRLPRTKLLAAFGDPVFPSNYAEFKGAARNDVLASATLNQFEPWVRAWRDIEIDADKIDPSAIQPLAFSKFELQKLSELGGAASLVARGFDASREKLTQLDLSQFAMLHFATHGVLDPKNPEISGFFLSMVDPAGHSQNGFITISDVYALNAPVDLVVLSACRTGLGKDVRGEGLIGLTSGFMHAGASSVAASLWKVDDRATSELMKYFYTNMLEKNMRPAEALRAAQNSLRTDLRWQSPHFWAAFTFQGEYQQPIRIPTAKGAPAKVRNAVGLALLLALLGGIGWGYWRRRGSGAVVGRDYSTANR